MSEHVCGDDPEPSHRFPAERLYVSVRSVPAGCAARLCRTPLGGRTTVGFTTERRLVVTPGPDQTWIRRGRGSWREWDPRAIGGLRVTGAAALVDAVSTWIG